jgi:hypothetical protein
MVSGTSDARGTGISERGVSERSAGRAAGGAIVGSINDGAVEGWGVVEALGTIGGDGVIVPVIWGPALRTFGVAVG